MKLSGQKPFRVFCIQSAKARLISLSTNYNWWDCRLVCSLQKKKREAGNGHVGKIWTEQKGIEVHGDGGRDGVMEGEKERDGQ